MHGARAPPRTQEDESLRKYKEALLGAAASGDVASPSDDPRRVVIVKMRVLFDDRPDGDIEYDLDSPEKLAAMKDSPFQLKEGCKYKIEVTFRVQVSRMCCKCVCVCVCRVPAVDSLFASSSFSSSSKRSTILCRASSTSMPSTARACVSTSSRLCSARLDRKPVSEKRAKTLFLLIVCVCLPCVEPHVVLFPRHGWEECPSGMLARGSYAAKSEFVDDDKAKHADFDYAFSIKKTY